MNILSMSRSDLEELSQEDRDRVLKESSATLTERVLSHSDFDEAVETIIQELQARGHELGMNDMNFDLDSENETSQLWAGYSSVPESASDPLIIWFHSTKGVEVDWSTVWRQTEGRN